VTATSPNYNNHGPTNWDVLVWPCSSQAARETGRRDGRGREEKGREG